MFERQDQAQRSPAFCAASRSRHRRSRARTSANQANETTRIDALIAKAEEHIALAKERRSALITAAVTGQIDVRTARKAS